MSDTADSIESENPVCWPTLLGSKDSKLTNSPRLILSITVGETAGSEIGGAVGKMSTAGIVVRAGSAAGITGTEAGVRKPLPVANQDGGRCSCCGAAWPWVTIEIESRTVCWMRRTNVGVIASVTGCVEAGLRLFSNGF